MGRGYRDSDSRRYLDWIFHAHIDYISASKLIDDERCYKMTAFHCQQCIEKALKGYLLFKKHRLFDGHNLPWLCKQSAQLDEHFSKWYECSTLLNRYYIESRYPADVPMDIDTDTIDMILHETADMLSFITEQIRFDFVSYHRKK